MFPATEDSRYVSDEVTGTTGSKPLHPVTSRSCPLAWEFDHGCGARFGVELPPAASPLSAVWRERAGWHVASA